MLGAAAAAFAQDDIKRLLAWSTISQVAFMLAGVAVSVDGAGAGGLPPALARRVQGAAVPGRRLRHHLAGSTRLADLGGLLARTGPGWPCAFGLGLAALAGLPPLGGFWSKEAVLSAAEHAASEHRWTGWLVLLVGLVTTLVTGLYCGRAWALVAGRDLPGRSAVLGDARDRGPPGTGRPAPDDAAAAGGAGRPDRAARPARGRPARCAGRGGDLRADRGAPGRCWPWPGSAGR